MDVPAITVIIPNWNQRELLQSCLESLARQTAPCAVLVVDNGSTDGSPAMVAERFPQFRCQTLDRNLGFAKAVNLGIRATSTAFVALLNNDTEVSEQWVEAGLHAFETYPESAFFASKIIDFFDRSRLDSVGDCYSSTGLPYKRGLGSGVDKFPHPEPVLGASAGAAFYRRELFERIGYFDESFVMYLEDVDLSLRAQLHGYSCIYLPEAVVYHMEAASDKSRHSHPAHGGTFYSDDRVYWITRNRWQLMVTYQPLRNLPFLLFGWSRSLLFHVFKAGFTGAFLRGLLSGVGATGHALRKRISLRRTRKWTNTQLGQQLRKC